MEKTKLSRQYPAVYEKIFPYALGFVGLVLVSLLVITVAVALRLVGGG